MWVSTSKVTLLTAGACQSLVHGAKKQSMLRAASKRLLPSITPGLHRAASAAAAAPGLNGFLGLPLSETQQCDPRDVDLFWQRHATPREHDFWETPEGHDIMGEWDNGPFGMEEGFCSTPVHPRDSGLPMTVLVMANMICEHAGFAPVDPHLRVSQHPGDHYREERVFFVSLEPKCRVLGNTGFTSVAGLQLVRRFVHLNLPTLLEHWRGDNSSMCVYKALVPVGPRPAIGMRGSDFLNKLKPLTVEDYEAIP